MQLSLLLWCDKFLSFLLRFSNGKILFKIRKVCFLTEETRNQSERRRRFELRKRVFVYIVILCRVFITFQGYLFVCWSVVKLTCVLEKDRSNFSIDVPTFCNFNLLFIIILVPFAQLWCFRHACVYVFLGHSMIELFGLVENMASLFTILWTMFFFNIFSFWAEFDFQV